MNRSISTAIIAFLVFTLAGCDSSSKSGDSKAPQQQEEAATSGATSTPTKKLDDWKQIQNDLVKIDMATRQYALDFKIDTADPTTVPTLEEVVETGYFRKVLTPPVEGTSYVMPSSWDDLPSWSGTPPKGQEHLYKHPDAP